MVTLDLTEPSHDLNNETVSCTDVFMSEWSEYNTEYMRIGNLILSSFSQKYRCHKSIAPSIGTFELCNV